MTKAPDLIPIARPLRLPFGRRGWLVAAVALIVAGAVFNWGWLTAIGAAPLILAIAPCAVMCAVGLCAKGGSKSCASKGGPAAGADAARDQQRD
ncbi:MAG: hypothetical protein LCH69_02490 [Proteobacteria bacterium]|nr:hypothetical protein [Pseudomonadota bacterium]